MERKKKEEVYINKISDFGEKIGGARKDIWSIRGLTYQDTYEMIPEEKEKYVVRDSVWPLPNAKKQVENGISPYVAYWIRKVRQKAYSKPHILSTDDCEVKIKEYIESISCFRDMIMRITTEEDIADFYRNMTKEDYKRGGTDYKKWCCVDVYSVIRMYYDIPRYKRYVMRTNFPYQKKTTKARKTSFIPPQLERINREGCNYRHGRNITADIWQSKFNFRGVEFGNWMTQLDRQASMNFCYDAFMDLATILDIADEDIAFGGTLALAFGARGHNRACAHYEPVLKVINLTKMRGAGSTAHEWMHALDHKLTQWSGIQSNKLASERMDPRLPKSFMRLVKALKETPDGKETEYYVASQLLDGIHSKESHGYWGSNEEMLARAFACYVKDQYGKKSDYLFAHSDCYSFECNGKPMFGMPMGEERARLNSLFDDFFAEMKTLGYLHPRPRTILENTTVKNNAHHNVMDVITEPEFDGQLAFVF